MINFKKLNQEDASAADEVNLNGHLQPNNNDILEAPFTPEEIVKVIKTLKNNKSVGIDGIMNEYIKATQALMVKVYTKLFNNILDTGELPSSWLTGLIVPIYKNKGDACSPDNYRGISLLSCLGKMFTTMVNNRLTDYANEQKLISENQAGFRKHYSTTDQIFVLKAIIDIYKHRKKKLYCGFVDFKKAFDCIWRAGLWIKLIENGITGKILKLIINMYKGIKSCVLIKGQQSDFFSCSAGLRQGENLSHFYLRCIYQ